MRNKLNQFRRRHFRVGMKRKNLKFRLDKYIHSLGFACSHDKTENFKLPLNYCFVFIKVLFTFVIPGSGLQIL